MREKCDCVFVEGLLIERAVGCLRKHDASPCVRCGHTVHSHNTDGLGECYSMKPEGGLCNCLGYQEAPMTPASDPDARASDVVAIRAAIDTALTKFGETEGFLPPGWNPMPMLRKYSEFVAVEMLAYIDTLLAHMEKLQEDLEEATSQKCELCGLRHGPGTFNGNGKHGWAECYYRQRLAEAEAHLAAREDALKKYGRHQVPCLRTVGVECECTCGFAAALLSQASSQ